MKNVIDYLKGKKTYIIAGAIVVLGTLQGLDLFIAPEWAWMMLSGLGLGTIRASVNKVAEGVKQE